MSFSFANRSLNFPPVGLKSPFRPGTGWPLENFLVRDEHIFVSFVNLCGLIVFELYTTPPLFELAGMQNHVLNRASENL